MLETPLTREDVEGVYAGLRPLLSRASPRRPRSCPASTPSPTPVPGLVVVAGGKYTTYRVMAKDAVDEAVHGLASAACRVPAVTDERAAARRRGLRRAVEPAAT